MARLNEVPASASTESLESLKRKFMRQNRDIARANSSQSLRIRNLENEVSKLLADNLGLRRQILRLQNEIDNGSAQKTAAYAIHIKSELEAKIQEIGALLGGLGETPKSINETTKQGRITRASPNTSPDQKNWKNMCSLSEAMAGQEGRLPPILENKQYPRKTLEQQELRDLISNSETVTESTESPDIGPPPISQFVDEDPVKIDLPRRQQRVDAGDGDDLGPALSFNLEQRRKRRESSGLNGQSGNDTIVVSTVPVQEVREPLKAGAKRKLSVREDDDQGSRIQRTQSSPDDFKFTRVVSDDEVKDTAMTQPETVNIKSSRELAVARGVSREKKPTAINNSMRKVLAPKSVNSSPKKTASRVVVDEIKAAKASVPRSGLGKDLSRECNREPILVKSDLGAAINTIEVQPEPETPAAVHIFSPSSSHPSTARPIDNRDTPPPSELNSGTEAVRPSRRARGAISYTEPSLRDKMRRPSKALADAVNRDGKIVQGSSVKAEDGSAPSLIIKTEPEDEDAWKRMPTASVDTLENSPLRAKATESDLLPSSITTHRKRRESILQQGPSSEEKSASENAISSLVAEHRKAKAFAREKAIEQESSRLTATMENLNVNESAELCPTDISTSKSVDDSKLKARPTRRQSSVPRDLTATEDGEASDIEATKRRQVTVTRRRQSTLDMQSGAAAPNGRIQSSLKKSYSSQDMTNDAHGDARSDRISARRRSMML